MATDETTKESTEAPAPGPAAGVDALAAAERRASEAEQRADAALARLREAEREAQAANAVIADLRQTAGTIATRGDVLQGELEVALAKLEALKLRCPKCGDSMREELYEGITIDRCGGCGGVYFDAGETEQLVHKIAQAQHKPGFWAGLFRKKSAPSG